MCDEECLDRIEKRLASIEELLKDHCYKGVPSDHHTFNAKLNEILRWMLRRREPWGVPKKRRWRILEKLRF